MSEVYHVPVMVLEVIAGLRLSPGADVIDSTVGGGGHSWEIGKVIAPGGRIIGIDRDLEALAAAEVRLKSLNDIGVEVSLRHGNFADMGRIVRSFGLTSVNSILMDLGVSSNQLNQPERGFSFRADGPLDCRLDASQGETAAELIARLSEDEIRDVIWKNSGEKWAVRIAKFIVHAREIRPIARTLQLAEIVSAAIPKSAHPPGIHPATRTMMALRIETNSEFSSLEAGLYSAIQLLKPGGRLVVICFHGEEERIVKQAFKQFGGVCTCPPKLPECRCGAVKTAITVTRKAIAPTEEELQSNPRSRSARIRIAERV